MFDRLGRSTLHSILLVCFADALVGMSFGAIATSHGFGVWNPVAMSVLVFGGAAQFAAVGVVLSGGSTVAAVAAGLLLNSRLLPYGLAVSDALSRTWWRRLVGAQVITDESVAFTIAEHDRRRRQAAFWTTGVGLITFWTLATAAGAVLGRAVPDTDRFGIDAMFPAVMLALVLPALARHGIRLAALVGAVIAVGTSPFLPGGLPVILSLAALLLARRPATGTGAVSDAGQPNQPEAEPRNEQPPDSVDDKGKP
jgi:4-azaleucine resistance transporter AzlC